MAGLSLKLGSFKGKPILQPGEPETRAPVEAIPPTDLAESTCRIGWHLVGARQARAQHVVEEIARIGTDA